MTTVALGPYEHSGAYGDRAESEVFDTSGTDRDFCSICEHSPCIAGAQGFCELWPRAIVVHAIAREIRDAPLGWSPHFVALLSAPSGLTHAAITIGARDGADALRALVLTRDRIRKAVRERSEVTR